MSKALVVLSGGQDSTTCLFWAIDKYDEVTTITFDYGQKHKLEIDCAEAIAKLAGVDNEVIEMGNILKGTSPLVNSEYEVEEYKDAESLPGGLEKTFVPSRNMLFLTIASNRAYVLDCDVVITGVSQEDFGGYPDCRASFIRAMEAAYFRGLERDIKIITPLINLNKKETVNMAVNLGGNCITALALSHTCYNGEYPPCGKCHACLLREKGFQEAGIPDPIHDPFKSEA